MIRGMRIGMAAVAVLAAIVLGRAALLESHQVDAPRLEIALDGDAAIRHLAEAIAHATVSGPMAEPARAREFERFRAWMAVRYPVAHATLRREAIGHSLLYTWDGTERSRAPVLFLAHQDVVAAERDDEWTHPPFAGTVADGYVWGRGALDMKSTLVGLLEAVEALLKSGYQPVRTLMLAFGHDEELGGGDGSARIASALRQRGVRLQWVLDEGLVVSEGILPGARAPVALVGVAEKGMLNIELLVSAQGGHASMPPPRTAPATLGLALGRIESEPLPARIDGAARQMLERLAPEMPFARRVAMANLWLLEPLVRHVLTAQPATNAMLRSTVAATVLEGSAARNVLARRARAVLNARIHPRDSIASVLEHVGSVAEDLGVLVRPLQGSFTAEPSSVSPLEGPGYRAVEEAIRATFPRALVAPGLLVGGTDSRHYAALADAVYRFMPARLGPADVARIHGVNERISMANVAQYVRFYVEVLRRAGQ